MRAQFGFEPLELTHKNVKTEEDVVISDYIQQKAMVVLREMDKRPFGHFAIVGPQGSGKMSFLHALNHQ